MENGVNDLDRAYSDKVALRKASTAVGVLLILFTAFIYISQIVLLFVNVCISNGGIPASYDIFVSRAAKFYSNSNFLIFNNSLTQIISLFCSVSIVSAFYKFKPLSIFKSIKDSLSKKDSDECIIKDGEPNNKFSTKRIVLIVFPIVFMINWASSLIISIIIQAIESSGIRVPEADFSFNNLQPSTLIIYFLALCVFAPLIEEFLFRGCIINILKPFGNWFAVIVSSVFFSLLHGNMGQGFGAFLIGMLFGFVAIKTKSILPTIILHSLNNFIPFLSSLIGNLKNQDNLQMVFSLMLMAIVIIGFVFFVIHFKDFKLDNNKSVCISNRKCYSVLFLNVFIFIYIIFELYMFFYQFVAA